MRTILCGLAVIVALNLGAVVTAHDRQYVNGIGDAALVCTENDDFVSYGGFCFPPNHVSGDENGRMSLTITDAFLNPVSGLYCQDLAGDGFCHTGGISFCGSGTFQQGVSWDPGAPVYVLVDGPVFGKPFLSSCHSPAFGTIGHGSHS